MNDRWPRDIDTYQQRRGIVPQAHLMHTKNHLVLALTVHKRHVKTIYLVYPYIYSIKVMTLLSTSKYM